MRKILKRTLSILLTAVMLLTAAPLSGFVGLNLPDIFSTKAEAATQPEIFSNDKLVYGSGGTITRIEWLHNLTVLFEMTVSEDNVPDNYFADLTMDSEYYKDAMLATEFGVVDVEAGENIDPTGLATREFAAHTLNFCLGFRLDNPQYTFSDVDAVEYDDDVQIAIDRNWFELVSGAFMPAEAVTTDEVNAMIADAQSVLSETATDHGTENVFEFAENVKVVTNGTAVSVEDDTVEIVSCPVKIAVGDIFVVFVDGLPGAFTAKSVSEADDITTITAEAYEDSDIIKNVQTTGTVDVDMSDFEVAEDVTVTDISADSKSRKAISQKIFTVPINFGGGLTASVAVKLDNTVVDYDINLLSGYYQLNLKSMVTTTVYAAFDFMEGAGFPSRITLGKINIFGIGSIDLTVNCEISGSIVFTNETYVDIGVELSNHQYRAYKTFQKKYFSLFAEINLKLYADLCLNANILGIIKGNVGACVGVAGKFTYDYSETGNTSKSCGTLSAWMFAEYYYFLTIYKDVHGERVQIYNQKNSPIRVYYHYENGKQVTKCSVDGKRYLTSAASRYNAGMRYADSTGFDAAGEIFTIYTYDLDEDNNATITGYNGNASALIIPETIDGYNVVAIGNNVFQNNTALRTVVMHDKITSIDSYAFYNCTNLSNVQLPTSLIELGYGAFANCTSLTNIQIPKSLNYSGGNYNTGAFSGCTNLKTVTFEKGTTKIVDYLFYYCPGIEEISIPDTVTSIGGQAFDNCTALSKITIPNTVTEIGSLAFYNCTNLSNVQLPTSLIELGYGAFANCTSLTNIQIPKSLNYSGGNYNTGAFSGCTNLKTVTFEKGTTKIVDYLFYYCPGIEEISIPDTVTSIGRNAFDKCTALSKITVPDSVTSIGELAFYSCSALTEFKIPELITTIQANTFSCCSALTKMTIPDKVTKISEYAFQGCSSLEEISIPDSVTTIGQAAFNNCTALKEITLPKNVSTLYSFTLQDCTSLEKVVLPENLTEIQSQVFENDTALKTIIIPNTVTGIGYRAFYNCDSLETIAIPDSVKTLNTYIFANCDVLKNVTLGKGLTTIPDYAFADCPAIEEIVIPKGVTTIKPNAFRNCTGLKKITIPVTVTAIDQTSLSYPDKTVIHGCKGTYAEAYASENGFKFVDITNHITGIILKDNDAEQVVITRGTYVTPEFEYLPADTTDIITLTSNNTSIVTVKGNQLYGNSNGTATVTATTSGGLEYTFSVYVRSLNSLAITTLPTQTKYAFGEALNTSGMVVSATYSDGVTETVTDYTISGYNPETYGTQKVYVSFGGRSVSFNVEVLDNRVKVTSIEVTTLPAKTEYAKGETFNPSGIVVTAYYSDGTSAPVNGYSISSMNSLKVGTQTLTVTYEGFTDTFDVIVSNTVAPHVCEYNIFSHYQTEHPHYAVYKCSCGAEQVTTETTTIDDCEICNPPEHTHTPKVIRIEPTCTVNGMEYTMCTTCGETIGETTILPAGHKWGEWYVALAPTNETDGREERVCSACGAKEERIIPKLAEIIKDNESGIELVIPNGSYDDDIELEIVEQFDGTSFQIVNAMENVINATIYDITTKNASGESVQPSQALTVKIPLPVGYDPNYTFVYHVNSETGKVENMKARYENGYLIFEATHFSYYSVVEQKSATVVSLTVTAQPSVNRYKYGIENLDTTGLEITATYSDGSTAVIDNSELDFTGFDTSTRGVKTITATYEGISTTFDIEVYFTFWQWLLYIICFGWIWM